MYFPLSVLLCLLCISAKVFADPQPSGGGPCSDNYDCGGIGAGVCHFNATANTTACVCPANLANPNCNYERKSKALCGGLQFICFAGVGGVGNFVCGRIGPAVGQLILMFAFLFAICAACFLACGIFGDGGFAAGGVLAILFVIILIGAIFAGFIWSIVDGAFYLQGRLNDGNGYGLY